MYVAAGAAALAVILGILVIYLMVTVRRLRANQRLVVGRGTQDLVEYAVGLLAGWRPASSGSPTWRR